VLQVAVVWRSREGGGKLEIQRVDVREKDEKVKRECGNILLNLGRVKLAADETLGVKDRVGGIHGDLVLGGIANETLGLVKGYIRRGGAVALVVGDNLHAIILPHAHARVRGTQVDSD
jgi:hypothetical protein